MFVRKGCREDLLPCNLHSCIKVKGSHGLGHFHTTHVLEKHTEKKTMEKYIIIIILVIKVSGTSNRVLRTLRYALSTTIKIY